METAATTDRADELSTNSAAERRTLFSMLVSRRRTLLRSVALGTILAVVIALVIPNHYEATVALMPPDQNSTSGGALLGMLMSKAGEGVGALAGDVLNVRSPGALLVGVLQSRTVEDNIINQFDLRKVYYRKKYVDTRKKLENRVQINEDRRTGIISIRVEDADPIRAAQMARGYVDQLNSLVSSLNTSSAHRERVFLEYRLQEIKGELDASALRLSQFSSKNRTLDPQVQGRAMIEEASGLQGRLVAAEGELLATQQMYGPDNVRVKSAQARVSALRSELRTMAGRPSSDRTDLTGHDDRPTEDSRLYPSLSELPLLGNTYADLLRRTKILEAVFEVLTKQYELAKVQEAKETPTVKVLDDAIVPEKKSWPPRGLIVLLGAALSAIAGAAFIVVTEDKRTRFSRLPWTQVPLRGLETMFRGGKQNLYTRDETSSD